MHIGKVGGLGAKILRFYNWFHSWSVKGRAKFFEPVAKYLSNFTLSLTHCKYFWFWHCRLQRQFNFIFQFFVELRMDQPVMIFAHIIFLLARQAAVLLSCLLAKLILVFDWPSVFAKSFRVLFSHFQPGRFLLFSAERIDLGHRKLYSLTRLLPPTRLSVFPAYY